MNPLNTYVDYPHLAYLKDNYEPLAQQAAEKRWSHAEYLQRLLEGKYQRRQRRALERRVHAARFPVVKTLDRFRWDWPTKINELQVKNLFRVVRPTPPTGRPPGSELPRLYDLQRMYIGMTSFRRFTRIYSCRWQAGGQSF